MGAFLSIDEYAYHDRNSTLWGFPGQNPIRWSDPTGHDAAGAAIGAGIGGGIGGWVGGGLGAAGGFVVGLPTGPGEVATVPAGAIGGFGLGASFGALVGGTIGDVIGDWINLQAQGQPNTPDQDAVIQIAKEAKQTGGVSPEDAETLEEWAQEYGVPFRDDTGTTHWVGGDHIHVGPVNHIPVCGP